MIHVTVWNEYVHEKEDERVAAIYPNGIHGAVAAFLEGPDVTARTATLEEPEHGLTQTVLDETDVLFWWGHMRHGHVSDEIVERVHKRVLEGMGLIVLHSGHDSKIFKKLMGTRTGDLRWHEEGYMTRLWVMDPAHPIAQGCGDYIELPQEETYGEHFDIPKPEDLVFVSWFPSGEVFRSGCCWHRGLGRIFYFQPGHESFPTYHNPEVQNVLRNAVRWAYRPRTESYVTGWTKPIPDITPQSQP